jgi:hypothetical protein
MSKKLFGVSEDKTGIYRNVNNPEYVPSLIPCSSDKIMIKVVSHKNFIL